MARSKYTCMFLTLPPNTGRLAYPTDQSCVLSLRYSWVNVVNVPACRWILSTCTCIQMAIYFNTGVLVTPLLVKYLVSCDTRIPNMPQTYSSIPIEHFTCTVKSCINLSSVRYVPVKWVLFKTLHYLAVFTTDQQIKDATRTASS